MKKAIFTTAALAIGAGLVGGSDVVSRLARNGKLANGSAFDKQKTPGVSGVYLDGMDPNASKKPTIPVRNPAGNGVVQVHPLQAPTSTGLGSLLSK